MKQFMKTFLLRGLVASSGGPLVLAIIYGILDVTGAVTKLSGSEVCIGIVSVTVLGFFVAGMTAIYQLERLPLATAIMVHGASLYVAYLLVYLLNGWLKQQLVAVAVFSACFLVGYAIIWLVIYLINKRSADQLSKQLHE